MHFYRMLLEKIKAGTSLKYVTAKTIFKSSPSLPSNSSVLMKFLEEGQKVQLEDCELLKYQHNSVLSDTASASMYQLVLKYKENVVSHF